MSFSLFQDRGKIGDSRNGVADLLGDTVEEDFLAIGTDLVPRIGADQFAIVSIRSVGSPAARTRA
jgi:hypothetical protein